MYFFFNRTRYLFIYLFILDSVKYTDVLVRVANDVAIYFLFFIIIFNLDRLTY